MHINEDFINDILEKLDLPEEFGVEENSEENLYDITDIINSNNAEAAYGATKMVIIPNDADYVIKVPFNGMWYDTETKNIYGEYEWETEFEKFQNANDLELKEEDNDIDNSCPDDDYCRNELIKYNIAVKYGFSEFFPKTEWFKREGYHDIYIQEKCWTLYGKDQKEVSQKTKDSYEQRKNELICAISKEWLLQAIEWYGVDRLIEFLKFANKYRMNEDLHTNNVGFNAEGAPIILDFSGFRE